MSGHRPSHGPEPRLVPPGECRAAGKLLQLERKGVLDLTPFRRSMFWWVPRALLVLVVFIALVILI
jgi:hypothetical protein